MAKIYLKGLTTIETSNITKLLEYLINKPQGKLCKYLDLSFLSCYLFGLDNTRKVF